MNYDKEIMDKELTAKVVLVKHEVGGYPQGNEYSFLVPYGEDLKQGDIVRVQTRRGTKLAECTSDSVEVSREFLRLLERVAVGSDKNFTGKVLGKYEYRDFYEPTEDDVTFVLCEEE